MNPDIQYTIEVRQTSRAYLLWFFLGAVGAHQFYLGRKGWGFIYLFTVGLLGIGVLFDLFYLPKKTRKRNEEIRERIYAEQRHPSASSDH